MKKVLITGAAGCLGGGVVEVFDGKWDIRMMDVVPMKSEKHEVFVGSVADHYAVEQAMEGVDGLVIAHMLSRTGSPHAYQVPGLPFDVNVKGTVNLFQEAWKQGVKNVALVSSTGVILPYRRTRNFMTRDLEPRSEKNFYGLTKVCQEKVAEFYHLSHRIGVAVLRVGCIVQTDPATKKVTDKYGKEFRYRGGDLVDRRDIGEVARRSLELDDLGYEVMYVMSTEDADDRYDMEYTRKRLDWQPEHGFKFLEWDPGHPEAEKRAENNVKERSGRDLNLL